MARAAEGSVQCLVSSPVPGIRMRRLGALSSYLPSRAAVSCEAIGDCGATTPAVAREKCSVRAPSMQSIGLKLRPGARPDRTTQLLAPAHAVNRSGAFRTLDCAEPSRAALRARFPGPSRNNLFSLRKLRVPVSFGPTPVARGRPRTNRSTSGPLKSRMSAMRILLSVGRRPATRRFWPVPS